jgi:hypothetical protein
MSRGDIGARRADIEGLCELNELDAGSVNTAKKNGHLETNTRRAAALRSFRAHTLLVDLDFQTPPVVPLT